MPCAPCFNGWLGAGRVRDQAVDFPSALMHLAHSTCCTLRPFCTRVTLCKLGRKARLVARIENERRCPNEVVLPHFAHLAIAIHPYP